MTASKFDQAALGLLIAMSTSLAGCIWGPANGTEQENTSSIYVSGWASTPGATVTLKARDYSVDALVTVGTATAGSTETYAGTSLYPWSTSLSIPNRKYWAPTADLGVVPASPTGYDRSIGRLELHGYEGSSELLTFSTSAQSCTIAAMANAVPQQYAGYQCSDGNSVALMDNTGVDVTAEPLSWTVIKTGLVGSPAVKASVVSYASDGANVMALVCEPLAGGTHPLVVYNHGGMAGSSDVEASWCALYAQSGFVWVHSAYRGEPLYVPSGWAWAPPYNSTGGIEISLGEVKDSLRLLNIARTLPNVDTNHVLMWGASHGGAITLRALEQGAKVTGAAAVAPATDWKQQYDDCRCTNSFGCDCLPGTSCVTDAGGACLVVLSTGGLTIPGRLGGTPAAAPTSYWWRSPYSFPQDLKVRSDVRMLIQHGLNDSLVRHTESCKMVTSAWGSTAYAWHVPVAGDHTTAAVAGCPATWLDSTRPGVAAWTQKRTFLVYDGGTHALFSTAAAITDFNNFVLHGGW